MAEKNKVGNLSQKSKGKAKRMQFVSIEEMNEHLRFCRDYRGIIFDNPDNRKSAIGFTAWIENKQVKLILTYRKGDEVCTYVCRKDGLGCSLEATTGALAYRIMSRYYKPPNRLARFSASPFLWYNPRYNNTRNHAFYYDLNSAYATVMAFYDFPDTSVPPQSKIVSKSEIGFDGDGNLIPTGAFALFVFPKMPSPFKDFAYTWFTKKATAPSGSVERTKAKNVLCFSVGYLQHVNPFLRAFIVNTCNNYIRSMIDPETTLYCNTDCIVSLLPLRLPVGNKLGEWKLNECEFAYRDSNYQINDEIPSYRGTPKGWFPKNFDILRDAIPSVGNIFELNLSNLQLESVNYE